MSGLLLVYGFAWLVLGLSIGRAWMRWEIERSGR